ncbi:MAG TPA: hypothetical protein VFS20_19905 [Longimicrobium sp.]|nr:hypothetical protein [Longimicrobium sp.]
MPRAASARRMAVAAALLPLLAACTDRSPLLPVVSTPAERVAAAECTVNVREQSVVCVDVRPAGSSAVRADRILGGQDTYVRLTSSNTTYDGDTDVLSTYVTVQNLLQKTIGVDSTSAVVGVRVFFDQKPTVTSGSGTVTLANADGLDLFTGSNQPYYTYAQSIEPYQVSSSRNWRFNVPESALVFVFTVYVSAPLSDYSGALLGPVWTGSGDGAWSNAANWEGGAVPDSASTVAIPGASVVTGTGPTLDTDGALSNLRVGSGSSLAMDGHTLTAWGNVDAIGALTGGTLRMRGGSALLGGQVSGLQVSGGVQLQKATTASGSVSVQDGALSVKDQTLTISVP